MYDKKIRPYLVTNSSGCIHWTKTNRAYVYVDRQNQIQVKRYLYEREFGLIPPYARVLRDAKVCQDDSCVNPHHKRVISEDQRLLNRLDRRQHALLYAPGTSPEARAKRRRGYAQMMRDFNRMRPADRSDQPTSHPSQAERILSVIRGKAYRHRQPTGHAPSPPESQATCMTNHLVAVDVSKAQQDGFGLAQGSARERSPCIHTDSNPDEPREEYLRPLTIQDRTEALRSAAAEPARASATRPALLQWSAPTASPSP